MDKHYYSIEDKHFYYGIKVNNNDIELTETEYEYFKNKKFIVNNGILEEVLPTAEDRRKVIEDEIVKLIQSKVDEYNVANDLSFKDVYRCRDYKDEQGYTHQAFCQSVWSWNVEVWEYARQELVNVLGGTRSEPTASDFIAEIEANVPLVLQ